MIMKKKKFLKRFNLMFFTLFSSVAISQIDLNCKFAYTDSAHGPYSASCQKFLQDFIPVPSDPVLYVNLAIWVFNKDDGSGQWNGTSLVNIQGKVDSLLNPKFTSLQPPKFPVTGVANISNSKIQFVLKSKGIFNFSSGYNSIDSATSHHYDQNAINVYYVGPNAGCDCTPGAYSMFVDGSAAYGNIYSKGGLEHELCHMLGLEHSSDRTYETTYVNTGNSCCPTLYPDDFHKELVQVDGVYTPGDEWATQFGDLIGCNFTNPYFDPVHNSYRKSSNNFMGYSNCRTYLSPQQLAVMHYHLRTDMIKVLTTSSYNNDLSRNSALDYNVQNSFGGETWTVNRYFKGNVTVKSGNTLSIFCKVGMAKNTHIIVERGAQLIINSGGEVTNISGQTWGGVQVYGTSNAAQMLNISTGFATAQGVCKLVNGGKISQAERGVANWYESSNGSIDWSSLGGIIIGNNGVFENNRRDVEFLSYQNPNGNDRSNFTNCSFITTTAFNSANPPYDHVSMWGVKGVWFNGCTFEYQAGNKYNNAGYGIKSMDAVFSVDKNGSTPSKFINLDRGVFVENSNPLKTAVINNSQFTDNNQDATYVLNMNGLIFNNNTVNLPYFYGTNGVYLNNCKNYQVKNNGFHENTTVLNRLSVGIYAFNSQRGSHQIYNNNFSNLEQGISVIGDNSGTTNLTDGLKMNCNDFTQGANKYDIAMLWNTSNIGSPAVTVMKTQGVVIPSQYQSPSDLVRNRYAASSSCSTCENKWYVQGLAFRTINHGSNAVSSTNTHPTPQPQNSDVQVNDQAVGPPFSTNQCPTSPGSNGGINPASQKLAGINEYLAALQQNNSTDNNLHFDIQATVAEKINYYVMDSTAAAADTVIHILANNQGQMENADVLLVYAYMHKGDYTGATTQANNLGTNRSAWKSLLLKLIEINQEPEKMYSLKNNATNVAFLQNYANNDTIDGQSAAQAILSGAMQYVYSEPRLHPDQESSSRVANTVTLGIGTNSSSNDLITIYPNPTSSGVFVEFKTKDDTKLHIVIKDLLGKIIYTNFTINQGKNYVPMQEFSKGVYFITVTNEQKQIMYQSKIVKQE